MCALGQWAWSSSPRAAGCYRVTHKSQGWERSLQITSNASSHLVRRRYLLHSSEVKAGGSDRGHKPVWASKVHKPHLLGSAIVWILSVPKRLKVLKAYSQLGTTKRWGSLYEVGHSWRSLGHWQHSLEGEGRTPVPSASSLLSGLWWGKWFYSINCSCRDVCLKAHGQLDHGPEPPKLWAKINLFSL
jgi:hypothetical protein